MAWALTIRALRLRQGLKQAALADLLGLDQATVSRWERGHSVPVIASQEQILSRIEAFDRESGHLQYLFDAVVRSPYRVLLTEPGVFSMVASSESAREYFELPTGPYDAYDWTAVPHTPHQRFVYEIVSKGKFTDKTIVHIQSCVALSMPTGEVVLNTATYYPVWTGEGSPRFIVKIEGRQEYDGRDGLLVIHRSTTAPESIIISTKKPPE